MNLFNFFIFFILFPKIIKSKIIVKIEWRSNKTQIPQALCNELESKENNRFNLKITKKMLKSGLKRDINKFTGKYDVYTFENNILKTDYDLPIDQQNNSKYILNVETFGEQLVTNFEINGLNKIIKIFLSTPTYIKLLNYDKNIATEIIRPTRILKFILNKFEKNLKLIIECKDKNLRTKFSIIESNDYYQSFYYKKNVCPNDEYSMIIEKIEGYSQLNILFNCDEALNVGKLENKYLINFDWNKYKNKETKFISCTLSKEKPERISAELIKNKLLFHNQINHQNSLKMFEKDELIEKSNINASPDLTEKNKGKASILDNLGIKRSNESLYEYINNKNKQKTYKEIYGGNNIGYKPSKSTEKIVKEAVAQIISSRNLLEYKNFNYSINDFGLGNNNLSSSSNLNNNNKINNSEKSAFKTWKPQTIQNINETNLNEQTTLIQPNLNKPEEINLELQLNLKEPIKYYNDLPFMRNEEIVEIPNQINNDPRGKGKQIIEDN